MFFSNFFVKKCKKIIQILFQIIYLCYCYYRSNKLVLYDIIMRSVKMKKRDSLKAISFFLPKFRDQLKTSSSTAWERIFPKLSICKA